MRDGVTGQLEVVHETVYDFPFGTARSRCGIDPQNPTKTRLGTTDIARVTCKKCLESLKANNGGE